MRLLAFRKRLNDNISERRADAVKKRWAALLLTLVLVTGVVSAGYSFFGFVSQTIYEESTAHLVEIFHQANQALYSLVSVN